MNQESDLDLREKVRERYAGIARDDSGCCAIPKSCGCSGDYSEKLGYSAEELAAIPEGAELGLGCGNPAAIAALSPGEVVLDLGSGAGIDCFLAANAVGPAGRVIGIDMTAEMIRRARQNAAKGGYSNVEFRLGEIENLPVADGSVDVILSNCVINLSTEKERVFREAFRVLKSGGRLAISDIVALQPLPETILADVANYTGCVAGAAQVEELERMLRTIGFTSIRVKPRESSRAVIREMAGDRGYEDYIASAEIEAIKP